MLLLSLNPVFEKTSCSCSCFQICLRGFVLSHDELRTPCELVVQTVRWDSHLHAFVQNAAQTKQPPGAEQTKYLAEHAPTIHFTKIHLSFFFFFFFVRVMRRFIFSFINMFFRSACSDCWSNIGGISGQVQSRRSLLAQRADWHNLGLCGPCCFCLGGTYSWLVRSSHHFYCESTRFQTLHKGWLFRKKTSGVSNGWFYIISQNV